MEKVLVTGGAGFIGSYVVQNLNEKGIHSTIFSQHEIEQQNDENNVFLGDITDREAVLEAVGGHDGVIHLAGILGTRETMENPTPSVNINVIGSLNVFEACLKHGKRAVNISVGNYWMNNPYAITKNVAERFALMYNKELGTKIANIRGLNVYGPRQKSQPVRKVVPTFILSALKGEDINIYGSGNQIMDMIYSEDMAEILVRALLMDHGTYDTEIDAGMGLDTTVNQLADLIISACNSSSKVTHVEMRPGEETDSIVKADPDTLKPLDFSEKDMTSLEDGLHETVEWYKTHG